MPPEPSAASLEAEAAAAYRAGRLEEAVSLFEASSRAYTDMGDHCKASEMANNLSVALLRSRRPKEALEAVRRTPEVFESLGDRSRQAMALGNRAASLEECGLWIEAEHDYRAAAHLFTELGEKDHLAHCLKALSRLQLKRGQPVEATLSMQSALEAKRPTGLLRRVLLWLLRLARRLTGSG
jgi:tetratricopeptide (TPR) repeat protein